MMLHVSCNVWFQENIYTHPQKVTGNSETRGVSGGGGWREEVSEGQNF